MKDHFCTSDNREISLPHLFEHLINNEEAKTCEMEDFVFVGTSEWLNRRTGTAKIELNFLNKEKTIDAISSAMNYFS